MKLPGEKLLSRLAPRDRRAVVLGSAVLAAALLVYWVLLPWVGHWSQCRDRIAAADAELTDLQARTSRYLNQRGMLAQRYGPGLSRPPEDVETASINFVKAVPEAMKSAGVQLQNMQRQPDRPIKELPGLCAVPFQVKASCSLAQLAQCLDALRESETLIVVEQVTAAGNDKRPGQVDVTLVLSALARQAKAGI